MGGVSLAARGPYGLKDDQGLGFGVGRGWSEKGCGGWGSSYMNRPSHHKYKSPKQFLLIAYLETSWENLMPPPRLALPVYPIMRTKRQMGQIKNRSREKSHKKGYQD